MENRPSELHDREIPDTDRSGILVVDVQDAFLQLVDQSASLVSRLSIFLQVPKKLSVPVLVTEQNPEELGTTTTKITEAVPEAPVVTKEKFNCFRSDPVREWCDKHDLEQVLVTGLMTNVCVLQSALLGTDAGYTVQVAADGCAAESVDDHGWALQRMDRLGISVTTLRTIVYGWLRGSDHPSFSELLPVLKNLDGRSG